MSEGIVSLHRRRGIVRRSVTRMKARLADIKKQKDLSDIHLHARQMAKKLEGLSVDLKDLHYLILEAVESEEDIAREQAAYDEVDDEISRLSVDVELLVSSPKPTDDGSKRIVSRKITHLKRKMDLMERAIKRGEGVDIHLLQQYDLELVEHKKELAEIHADILVMDFDDEDEDVKVHSSLEELAFCISLKIRRLSEKINEAEALKPYESIKLPKLEVPKFSGDIIQWSSFWEQFYISIHSRSNLSDAEKLVYLQQSLKDGSAKTIIEGLSRSGDCYEEAIQSLKARYDRPRIIHQTHVKMIVEAPALKDGTGKELRRLYDTVQQHLRALKAMGHEPSGAFITSVLELKLDGSTMFEWQRFSQEHSDVPHFSELLEFINLRAQASETCAVNPQSHRKGKCTPDHGKGGNINNKHITSYVAASEKSSSCVICKTESHPLYVCSKFRALPHTSKLSALKSSSVCLNCLKPGHYANQCKSINRCKICQRPHHSLLHVEPKSEQPVSSSNPIMNSAVSHTVTELNSNALLMTCKVYIEAPDGNKVEIRGILDSASSVSFISERIVQALGFPRTSYKAKISGITGLSCASNSQSIATFNISSVYFPNQVAMNLSAIIVPRITCDLPVSPVSPSSEWRHLSKLQLADPTFGQPGRIDILLGVDIFTSVLLQGRRYGPPGSPVAIKTRLGWVVAGKTESSRAPAITCHLVTANQESTDNLLRQFWEVEKNVDHVASFLPQGKDITVLSPEEKQVFRHFQENHCRIASGAFVVPLPKRESGVPLGESRSKAVKRFLSLEKSLKSRELKEEFHGVMEEYFNLGHAEVVPMVDLEKPADQVFYLPMHAIRKESSTTTKLRIVFDASAKSSTGISLNDTLLVGHTVHPPLLDVLLRFRLYRVAVVADVSKMYRAIHLNDCDKDLHRFLWRRNPEQPLIDFRMTRVTFGVSASSFAANMALKQNAIDYSKEYPLAAAMVNTSFYVDDGLMGADSVDEAIELVHQCCELFSKGGFLLRKWNSSDLSVLRDISSELRSTQTSHILSDVATEYTKTLGIEWNSVTDHFRLSVSELPPISALTKRALVSDIAKTFDILGLFSPTIIKMKILLQRTWEEQIGWDDVIPDEIQEIWHRWRTELQILTTKYIPRCYFPKETNVSHKEIHGFCDASESAYSAVVYFRFSDKSNEIHTSLVIAKTRVAPIKRLTIPRLELCGAQLLAHLLLYVKELFGMQFKAVHAWTDSTVVLSWLTGNPRRLKTFVGNRVSDIIDSVPSECWNHVDSLTNPADCASRGIFPSELLHHDLWWNGPPWLKSDPAMWPKGTEIPAEVSDAASQEERSVCLSASVIIHPPLIPIDRFSSFIKFKYITGWVNRFIRNCRVHRDNRIMKPFLTVNELRCAEQYWLMLLQRDCFLSELEALTNQERLNSSSALLSLSPMLDSTGIIRIKGRQGNSTKPYTSVHPVILHGKHSVTKLIIRGEHLRLLHAGPTLVHSSLSSRFHIIGGYKAVRNVTRQCVKCRKLSAHPQTQIMGELPVERVTPDLVFSRVGLDYAGPFYTKYGYVRKPTIVKSYACVFVSLSIKAVHLELVSDLTSEAFVACLRRFVARRGKPELICSDNGTNFVKANKEIREFLNFLQQQIVQKTISEYCSSQHIEWKFMPQHAPHFGGLWESTVKSMKYHMRRVIGETRLTFEELTTLLTQIEACLNSRPLTPISSHEEGIEVLTPGHFLVGRPLEAIPDPKGSLCAMTSLKRWHLVQCLVRHFWQRWSDEYLTSIRRINKWHFPNRNIKVGDIVIMKEDGLVNMKWPMARVLRTHDGKDGYTRVATVKTATGTYKRPTNKLILLLPEDGHVPSSIQNATNEINHC